MIRSVAFVGVLETSRLIGIIGNIKNEKNISELSINFSYLLVYGSIVVLICLCVVVLVSEFPRVCNFECILEFYRVGQCRVLFN